MTALINYFKLAAAEGDLVSSYVPWAWSLLVRMETYFLPKYN